MSKLESNSTNRTSDVSMYYEKSIENKCQIKNYDQLMEDVKEKLKKDPDYLENYFASIKMELLAKNVDFTRFKELSKLFNDSNYFFEFMDIYYK